MAILTHTRTLTVFKNAPPPLPGLWSEIYVSGPPEDTRGFAELFGRANCTGVLSPDEADIVVFTGGPDVDPAYYGETRHLTTFHNESRDCEDIDLYMHCLREGIPMFGVCRGAQFLHVMNGGKLIQDLDGHNGDHMMWDVVGKRLIERVSSVHHQAVLHEGKLGMKVLGTATKSTRRVLNATVTETGPKTDIEAFFYPETCCFGVQGHPEYRGYDDFATWCLDTMIDLFIENADLELREGVRRIKTDILEQRQSMAS